MAFMRWPADVLRDVRYAVRVLLHSPVFTLVAAMSLALGIGGAATVFTLINAVILRSLPVPNPQQLYAAEVRSRDDSSPRFSWPAFERAREAMRGTAELAAATSPSGMQLRAPGTTSGTAERGLVQLVSGEYFSLLRQQPQLGRLLTTADNTTLGAHPVTVISDAYWQRQFARSPDIVNRTLVVNNAQFTIVGVASRRFFGTSLALRGTDVWVPLMMQPVVRYAANASDRGNTDPRKPWVPQQGMEWLNVFARIAPPATPDAVGVAMTLLHQQQRAAEAALPDADPEDRDRFREQRVLLVSAARGISQLREDISTPLMFLLAMVGILLAIACGNVASLLVARAAAREREIAIRLSIGAGRSRLIRQLLAESIVLALVGGALGLFLAAWGRDLLIALFARGASVVNLDTGFDWRVLAFAVAVTVGTGIVVGMLPALRATRVPVSESLKLQSRTVGNERGWRGLMVGKVLVAFQIAFCLLMLVAASLFTRSMRSLLRVDVGYDTSQLIAARLDSRSPGFNDEERQAIYRRVIEHIRAIPGVTAASASQSGPLTGSYRVSSLSVEGYTRGADERLSTQEEVVTDDYFNTVGLRLLAGRMFVPEDRTPGRRSTIINETMARRFFPNQSAIGKRWSYGGAIGADAMTIVGVVEDAKYNELRGGTPNMTYRLSDAFPSEMLGSLEVRTALPAAQLSDRIRQAVVSAEPRLPIFDVVPLSERISRGASTEVLVAQLTRLFGALALALAALGIYGTVSYGVSRRVSELGLRMALGADRAVVLRMVMREALQLLAVGALLGVPLAIGAGRAVATLLYGIPPTDAPSFLIGSVLLLTVGLGAAYVPAYRASRIDPMTALRKE